MSPRPSQADYTLRVNKNESRGVWEGWGCSLAWWANAVGGRRYQDLYADLFFTEKPVVFLGHQLPGLGMNIVRYNVGGGGRGDDKAEKLPPNMDWYKAIDGYWLDGSDMAPASKAWDWTRDASQRAMLQAAGARGVDHIEFFANAPMWWMSTSKSSAGGSVEASHQRDFVLYLATVAEHAQKSWGIKVDAVEPFNEPAAKWWNYPKNQEGSNISPDEQALIVGYLRQEMNKRGLRKTAITASDENSMRQGRATYQSFEKRDVMVNGKRLNVAELVDKVNVHGYSGLSPWRDNAAREAMRTAVGAKKLWMSEYGDNDGSGMALAQSVIEDLNYLRPTAWIYWQPVEPYSAWGLVNGVYRDGSNGFESGTPKWIYTKYFVLSQFSRFLRPGFKVIGSSDNNSVVAYDRAQRKLVIITVNYGTEQSVEYDLSSLKKVGTTASMTATYANGSRLFETVPLSVDGKKFTVRTEPSSIRSIVVNDVVL